MSFQQAVSTVLTQKYADFGGRARRSEYWWFVLFNMLVSLVANILSSALDLQLISWIVTLALFVPGLAVSVRRLHDVGRSGWWILISLTVIGLFVLLYWYVKDSEPGTNAHGPSPKGEISGYGAAGSWGSAT